MNTRPSMNETVIAFEAHLELAPRAAARVLGVGYSTYAHYRSGMRPLPRYHQYHMQDLLALTRNRLLERIMERTNGHPN